MTQAIIKHASFSYRTPERDPLRPDATIFAERQAGQGEVVDIPLDVDYERGVKFGAFLQPGETMPGGLPNPPGHVPPSEEPTSDLTDEELVQWISEDKPTVQEVIDAADGDPEQARRLLRAEEVATDSDPRKGVVTGLTAILANNAG